MLTVKTSRTGHAACSILSVMLIVILMMMSGHQVAGSFWENASGDASAMRKEARKKQKEGNYKDAYEIYSKIIHKADNNDLDTSNDYLQALQCLNNLGRTDEIDQLNDELIEIHAKSWRMLSRIAINKNDVSYGFIIGGKYTRGNRHGGANGAKFVNSFERDKVHALQLMKQAEGVLEGTAEEKAQFYYQYAEVLLRGRTGYQSWKLQELTDLEKLPDYDESGYYGYGWGRRGYRGNSNPQGAPVDSEGNPVYYAIPDSWEKARNDGERWRFLLEQAVKMNSKERLAVDLRFAGFLHEQFGVQTMGGYYRPFAIDDQTDKDSQTGKLIVHTLSEEETIAKLATGVKRFKLPEEYNFIKLYQKIAAAGKSSQGESALDALARIFSNRQQYPKSAEYWKKLIAEYGPGPSKDRLNQLNQIIKNWGSFDGTKTMPAGQAAAFGFKFRNATSVEFTANKFKLDQMLNDLKAYLKSNPNPQQLDYNKLNIESIGYGLFNTDKEKYIGEKLATWSQELKPAADHFDRRIQVNSPLLNAGVYVITAKVNNGNECHCILWLDDTAILQKHMGDSRYFFVADARSGAGLPEMNLEFLGYRQRWDNNKYLYDFRNFADKTDAQGALIPSAKQLEQDFNWITIARGKDGRLAFDGFNHVWYYERGIDIYDVNNTYIITDRPVYRPEQKVEFKMWLRNARYDLPEDASQFAHEKFTVQINNPMGEKIYEKEHETDDWGGLTGTFEIPKDAKLGVYSLMLVHKNIQTKDNLNLIISGQSTFRIEEYKKPEFEVTVDAPDEPVMLGDKISAKINAKYFFGAPVTSGKVKYKVERTNHNSSWFPYDRWDWLYGSGYWWFAYDYEWYPGFSKWGCFAPYPWWRGARHDPPEMVLEREVPLDEDGILEIEIDTSIAKELHPDQDHSYTITAEVTDESRRTIVGTGNVIVARKPFQVFTWLNKGYYQTGDTIEASFKAQTLDQKPVQGEGTLKLLKISYNDKNEPVETEVESWKLETNAQGEALQKIKAGETGQYRISCKIKDKKGNEIEGGFVFIIRGDDFKSESFRYNDIEVIQDNKEYKPGDKARLLINTNRRDSTVLLFLRALNGNYTKPVILKIPGKSIVYELDITNQDLPNFFVEAVTVSSAQVHEAVREILVPPVKRVLNIKVEPSAQQYQPGKEATVKVQITDIENKPFKGSLVMSVYDRSVEYISGGSNVSDILSFFWSNRRSHNPQTIHSLGRYFGSQVKPNVVSMQNLGVFGHLSAETDKLLGLSVNERRANAVVDFAKDGEAAPMAAAPAAGGFGGAVLEEKSKQSYDRMLSLSDEKGEVLRKAVGKKQGENGINMPEKFAEVSVRSNFADTAYWNGMITTNEQGFAEVSFKMPENLTDWKIRTWGMGNGTRVGEGSTNVQTSKNLLVRLQAPRFFTETDEVVLSANVHNYLKTEKATRVELLLEGNNLESLDKLTQDVLIPANGEKRIDWRVKVLKEGQASITMKAMTDEESDAMLMKFPVYVHGIQKVESYTGVIRPNQQQGKIEINIPAERRPLESKLELRYSPTLAGAMVDALPYLAEYPYGCTEQTLNRFLPTVITQNILKKMNLDLNAIKDKRSNLNAQEIGKPDERAKGWKRFNHNPVFDQAEVDEMVKVNVQRLTEMQLSDGGWGWFSGFGEHSYPHTTAVVVHGLQIAVENNVALVPGMLENGIQWLERYQAEQIKLLKNGDLLREQKLPEKTPYKLQADNLDALVYMILVDAGKNNQEMLNYTYRDRTHLSVYSLGMLGLAYHKIADQEKLNMILSNIDQYLVQDNENQTAYLKIPEHFGWWYWYGSEIEANAYYLKLLSRTDPQGEKASRLVKYLLNNRKHATYWNSTRDTALCIEAMAEFMVASGEDQPDLTLEVLVDGQVKKTVTIKAADLFTYDDRLIIEGEALTTGRHTIELRKTGKGPVYWNAYVTNFTLEEFITKAGLEVKVNRKFFKLIRDEQATASVAGGRGQAIKQKVEKFQREELPNLSSVKSGDLVEIELTIDSKNDYEYLLFEDRKAAGFEPVDVRSGYIPEANGAYVEFRDERVAFFMRTLPRGQSSVSYRLRAEIPGKFSALPANASAMYAPELRGNSDEMKIMILDQ